MNNQHLALANSKYAVAMATAAMQMQAPFALSNDWNSCSRRNHLPRQRFAPPP